MSDLMKDNLVWIVEDEEDCRFVYSAALELRFRIRFFEDISSFNKALDEKEKPEVVISDLKLPDQSFLEFLATEDAKKMGDIPFFVVSSVDDIDVLKRCFEEGAIDYLTKPFNKPELLVKIQRILQQVEESRRNVSVDSERMKVSHNRNSVRLTPKEMQILSVLKNSHGAPVTRDAIIGQVWEDTAVGSKALDVHLFNLRKKTKDIGLQVQFVAPNSYCLID